MRGSLCATASLAALLTIGAVPALATPAIHLTDAYDHPGANVGVNGSGFGAYATIDIYFDTTDELIITANASGAFSKHTIPVPADALPGEHWISAAERDNGQGAQKPFTVSTDWVQSGFDTRNRRNNRWENVVSTGNVSTLDTMWSRKTGDVIESSPAVANGIAYIGSDDASLYALDVVTGKVLWSVSTGGPVRSSPAVAAGIVYFGSEDGSLYAIDAATGAAKWSFLDGEPIDSSPVVANGIVYVGSTSGILWALDAATGASVWGASTGNPIQASPAVADGAVYVVNASGLINAFDATSGTLLWNTQTGYPDNSAPTVSAGNLYVLSSNDLGPNFLERFRAADGFPLNVTSLGGVAGVSRPNPTPAAANGTVYVSVGNESAPCQIVALRPSGQNLSTVWTADLDQNCVPTGPAVANRVVYVGAGNNGDFVALDAATGSQLWSGLTDGAGNSSSPAVSNGIAFIGGDKRLFAFALNGGNKAVYKRRHVRPPALASLHPDYGLRLP